MLILHLDVLEDDFASAYVTLVPLFLPPQEVLPIMLHLLQAFVSGLESLKILRPVFYNQMIRPLGNFSRLCSLSVRLVHYV